MPRKRNYGGRHGSYGCREIARMIGVDESTIARYIDNGSLPGYRTPGGHRRVWEADLFPWLRAHGFEDRLPIIPSI